SGDKSHVGQMCEQYRKRRDRLVDGLSALPGLRCNRPRGAFYVFLDVRGWLGKRARGVEITDDIALANWVLDQVRVAVVPGAAFGTPGFLRLSYATSESEIEAAVERFAEVARELG